MPLVQTIGEAGKSLCEEAASGPKTDAFSFGFILQAGGRNDYVLTGREVTTERRGFHEKKQGEVVVNVKKQQRSTR